MDFPFSLLDSSSRLFDRFISKSDYSIPISKERYYSGALQPERSIFFPPFPFRIVMDDSSLRQHCVLYSTSPQTVSPSYDNHPAWGEPPFVPPCHVLLFMVSHFWRPLTSGPKLTAFGRPGMEFQQPLLGALICFSFGITMKDAFCPLAVCETGSARMLRLCFPPDNEFPEAWSFFLIFIFFLSDFFRSNRSF